MQTPGQRLRLLRENLGLTGKDVEMASLRISSRTNNPEFVIGISRLSDIETKGALPTIYRMYSFSAIYRTRLEELLELYGINDSEWLKDSQTVEVSKTHLLPAKLPQK